MIYEAQVVPTCGYPIDQVSNHIVIGDQKTKKSLTFKNVEEYSYSVQPYSFRMNRHFLQMRNSTRYIEISHWGNIYFKDVLDMVNRGANFEGHYSNIDLKEGRTDSGKNAFRGT